MKLCDNCLETDDVREFPFGHALGSQRDPIHPHSDLCAPCRVTLGHGGQEPAAVDLAGFHARWVAGREVSR